MIKASTSSWREPMTATARRKWLRAAAQEKVVAPDVIAELRRQRAECAKRAASTIIGQAIEQGAAAQ